MKKTHYRILALLLSLVLMASLISPAYAVGGDCGANVRWDYYDGRLIISGSGDMDDYSDADQLPWADYDVRITSVTIGSGVTSVGSFAFYGLYNLQSVSLGSGLKRIGDLAFADCHNLESITLPNGLTSIGMFAFASVYSIEKMNIPASVTHIGYGAFSDMSALTEITVSGGGSSFTTVNGALYDSAVTELIACPAGKTGSFTMPGSVTSIADFALMGCQISSLTLPQSLKSIGNEAFRICGNLEKITIPRNVNSIGSSAFTECSGLKTITVVSENKSFSSKDGILYSYSKDSLVCYPMGKDGDSFTVPDSVKYVNDFAFAYSSKLKSVTFGDGVESVGNYVFMMCDYLKSVSFGKGLLTLGDYVFANCVSLKSLELPSALETVGTCAFSWCEALENVVFNSPAYLGYSAFYWCTNLKRVEFHCDAPEKVGDDLFYACEDAAIYYYSNASGWSTPEWHNYLAYPMEHESRSKGDIDGNGEISNTDLVMLARYVVGIGSVDKNTADMDGNGKVDNADLVILARLIVTK